MVAQKSDEVRKEYVTQNYRAWVSGYNVALDSIDVFPKTVYITKKIPTRLWGLGCLSVMGQDDPDCRHMSKWGCITGFGNLI